MLCTTYILAWVPMFVGSQRNCPVCPCVKTTLLQGTMGSKHLRSKLHILWRITLFSS